MPFRTVLARLTLHAVAFAVLPLAVAVGQMAVSAAREPAPKADVSVPAEPPIPYTDRPTAVFLVGNHGTELSDLLPPFAAIAASGAFNVVTVAPSRRPSPLLDAGIRPTGLSLVPDYALDGFEAAFPGAPELVVVPYIPAFAREDRALVAWLRGRVGQQTVILTICAGTTLAAETGLMEGARATSHFRFLAGLRERHPGVQWQEDLRYVVDGRFITSGALLSGIDAALAAVHRIAGKEAALRAAAAIQADATSATDPRPLAPSPNSLRSRLHEFFGPHRGEIGLRLTDGADEMMVAAVADMLSVSVRSPVRTFADVPGPIRTRFGLTLVPELAAVEPGVSTIFESLTAQQEPIPAFDVVLDWIAAEQGTYPARRAAERFAYPAALERADGSSGDARPLIAVALLGGLGAVAFRVAELTRRRRRADRMARAVRDGRGPCVARARSWRPGCSA
jgi:transcriptional regulator GlxA family with amidase domain